MLEIRLTIAADAALLGAVAQIAEAFGRSTTVVSAQSQSEPIVIPPATPVRSRKVEKTVVDPAVTPVVQQEAEATIEKPEVPSPAVVESPNEPAPDNTSSVTAITAMTLRNLVVQATQKGLKADARNILIKYGANGITDLATEHYAAVNKELLALI